MGASPIHRHRDTDEHAAPPDAVEVPQPDALTVEHVPHIPIPFRPFGAPCGLSLKLCTPRARMRC